MYHILILIAFWSSVPCIIHSLELRSSVSGPHCELVAFLFLNKKRVHSTALLSFANSTNECFVSCPVIFAFHWHLQRFNNSAWKHKCYRFCRLKRDFKNAASRRYLWCSQAFVRDPPNTTKCLEPVFLDECTQSGVDYHWNKRACACSCCDLLISLLLDI